jgi:hypothetical protein
LQVYLGLIHHADIVNFHDVKLSLSRCPLDLIRTVSTVEGSLSDRIVVELQVRVMHAILVTQLWLVLDQ